MSEKRSAFYTVLIIASMILLLSFADLLQKDRIFSETENKMLASKPVFTVEALLRGSYTEDYETYLTDQFIGREKWISVKTYLDILLQRREINGVYLGADDYLIEQHLPETYAAEEEQRKIELLAKLAQRWDAAVMLVPTADNILTDKLPAHAPYYDERKLLDRIQEAVGSDRCVDVYSALQEHAGEEIYYRTDHHWTALGAYYGYLAWAEAQGKETDFWDASGLEIVTEEFLGTLHSKVNLNVRPDSIACFPETLGCPVSVTYDLQRTTDTCYEESYLDTKNKYGFFLDDNHAFVEIDTGCRNGETLFVIKDSYANCFIPMLLPHYERIFVMDLRYYNGRLFGFMENYEPEGGMDVLVLYNCIHFLEDFAYVE